MKSKNTQSASTGPDDRKENILKKSGRDLGVVIVLDIPKEDLVKRITGRFSCEDCGEIHNIYSDDLKPKKENTCDILSLLNQEV